MKDSDWFSIKERFEIALKAFVTAIDEDDRDLEDEFSESFNAVIDDKDIDISVY